jgi:TIR domain
MVRHVPNVIGQPGQVVPQDRDGLARVSANRDFFISYTQADRAWAEWLAWELEAAGYTTMHQAWDMPPGVAFVHVMNSGQECVAGLHAAAVARPSRH